MNITYKNNKIKKVCTDARTAEKTYGREMADEIQIANILEIVDYH